MEYPNEKDLMYNQIPPCPGGIVYAVRPGQSLFVIAGVFSVSVSAIIQANPGITPERLSIGQLICIPGVAERICPRGRLRTVRSGDTFSSIAQQEGVPLNVLIEANFWIPNPNLIFPGEQLCIPLVVAAACCLVLQPTAEASNFGSRGVALIEPIGNGGRVTVTVVGLPEPSVFGNFDTYRGSLVFREIERLIPLERVTLAGQPSVWSGAVNVDVLPLAANLVAAFPFNSVTEARGQDVLRGSVISCQPSNQGLS